MMEPTAWVLSVMLVHGQVLHYGPIPDSETCTRLGTAWLYESWRWQRRSHVSGNSSGFGCIPAATAPWRWEVIPLEQWPQRPLIYEPPAPIYPTRPED